MASLTRVVPQRKAGQVKSAIDTSKPHTARMYDCLLGGKDHFAVDRSAVEQLLQLVPTLRTAARENRAFLGRAVRYVTGQAGIRQFLDIGTGLPSANNVHEVAQAVAPQCRVVYADNDPIVLAHARALLTSARQGRTAYVEADLREPETILSHPVVRDTLDFSRPVALLLVAVLHFFADEDNPRRVVETLLAALPPGSYLIASHGTAEFHDPQVASQGERTYQQGGMHLRPRTCEEFAELAFTGLQVVDPGVVLVSEWRPDTDGPRPLPAEVNGYGGVALKP